MNPYGPVARRGDRPRLALVLAGGGARGAYEAGVMRYIREDLAADLGGQVQFDILCGTSVGAIHVCMLAGTLHDAANQGRFMCQRWEDMVLEEIVSFGFRDFLRAPGTLLGSGTIEQTENGERRLGGIVQTRKLERMVRRLVPWSHISRNCARGLFEALSVTATDIGSGKTVVFVERADGRLPPWSRDPFVRAQAVRMAPEHALASAALPILFPAIEVGKRFYCDGGLRQNTPISPALRLGADKVLVVGMRQTPPPQPVPEETMPYPGAAFLVGKVLNAFMLDHVDYDLERLRRLNAVIEAVKAAGNAEHFARFQETMLRLRGAPYRVVGEMMIRPSEDLGAIAGDIAKSNRFKGQGGGPGIRLLRRLAALHVGHEADLLSYILFDGHYAAELIRLGYEDARRRHVELAHFLSSAVLN